MEEIKNTKLDEEITEEQEIAQKPLEEKVVEKPAKKNGLLTAGVALMFATSALSLGVSCYQIFSKDKNDNSNVGSHENIGSVNYGQSSVSISEDGYWVINGTKTNVKAEAQDGQNGENGQDGVAAPTIVDARVISLDPWNIKTCIVFTMSDGSYVTTNATEQVLNNHYYEAANATDLVKLVENYGVEKVRFTGNVALTRVLEIEKNVEIDLNGKTLTYTSTNPIKVEADCNLTLKNGVVDFQTDKAIVLEGNNSGVEFDGVNIKASSTVVEALGANASIKLASSTLTTVEPEVESYSTAVASLFVIKGANANIEVKAVKIKTSKVIVAATEEAEAFSLKLETTEVDTTANILSVNTEEVVPTLVVDDATIEAMDEGVVLNDSPITNGNFNFDLPSEMLGEGLQTFSVNGAYVVAEDFNALVAKVEAGSVISLTSDIELEQCIRLDKKLTIDLCGYEIYRVAGENTQTILVLAGGDLTIEDSMRMEEYFDPESGQSYPYQMPGGVDGSGNGETSMAIWAYGGKVTINGGYFYNNPTNGNNAWEVLYASNGGSFVINGGYFMGATPEWTVNIEDDDRRAGTSTIVINGGEFFGFNPANCIVEGQGTNFVGEGNFVYSYVPYDEYGMPMGIVYVVESIENFAEIVENDWSVSEVTLCSDVDLEIAIFVRRELTVNLNGHTITAKNDTEGYGLFCVETGGKLTINGEGTLDATTQANDYAMVIWATNDGEVIINGGTYTNVGSKRIDGDGKVNNNEVIYVSLGGKATINGGTFIGNNNTFVLNSKDGAANAGTIIVNGGTFHNYNPAESYSENPAVSFVADGYKVVENNGVYTVVEAEGVVYASTEEKLLAAVADETATTIVIVGKLELESLICISRKVTFELNGCTITRNNNQKQVIAVLENGELTINGEGTISSACEGARSNMAIYAYGGTLIINGGTYTNKGATGRSDDHYDLIYASHGGQIVINGGEFYGESPEWILNILDESRTDSSITVNGGVFNGLNPSDSSAEGKGTNFVADGYKVVENNGVYTVVAE